ncbi:MAG: hypothetical protein P8I03_04505 [Thalassotalea sp.]|nr:hypothetical protein [Thalassotalea sp.]
MKLNIKKLLSIFALSLSSFIVQANYDESILKSSAENKPLHVRPGQALALRAIEEAKYQVDDIKMLVLDIEELADNQGLKYLAGLVNKADIEQYLTQLKIILGDEFEGYRQHQSARDHGSFHVTLVNPYEYQTLAKKDSLDNKKIRVQLHGLGRVSQGDNTTYFVVADSPDGQFLRQNLLLKEKDFHVTLGFKTQDVYGIAKNKSTLIK